MTVRGVWLAIGAWLYLAGISWASAPVPGVDASSADGAFTAVVHVPRVDRALELDGEGGDPAWARAAVIELQDYWSPPGHPPAQATQVSLLHDGEALYIAFDCEDSEVLATCRDHDGQTFRDDCVEFFFGAPLERLADTASFEINALGTVADYYYRHADWINYRFESGAQVAASRLPPARKDATGYRLEIMIPLAALAPVLSYFPVGIEKLPAGATPENALRANFARWDRSSPGEADRFTIWTNPGYSFAHPHQPEAYGWLILED